MSSLAGSLSSRPSRPRARALGFPGLSADTGLTLAVTALLSAVAFAAGGGLSLERTAWTEIALILVGGALAAAAILVRGFQGRLHGGVMLLGLAALAAYTALSIVWSLAPSESWLEASRTFAYVSALAGALALVQLAPGRWAAVLQGVGLACVVVCAWGMLTKIFPEALAADETFARLRQPFGYWNAVGLMAALGVPPMLWLAARRSGHPAVNALGWPALGLLFACLMLSYSRGALLALVIGVGFWFAAVPLRLRGAVPLLTAAAVAAPLVAWAFARDALSNEQIPLAARSDAGHALGALLFLMVAILLVTGLAVGFAVARRPPSARLRRLAGRGLVGLLVCVPLVAVLAVAVGAGGLEGRTADGWEKLTNPRASTPSNTPDRLTATSSVRARYWREALDIFESSRAVGAGAGSFVVARTRYRADRLTVRHAHGYAVQTLADLGLIGIGLSLLVTVAWLAATARSTGMRPRDRGLPYDAERIGLLTMATVVVVFAIHSLIDWTWFVPATAVVALLCAGWVAGRGPRGDRAALAAAPRGRARHVLAGAAAAVLALALIAGWAVLQPVRAARADDAAVEAVAVGKYDLAAREARRAEHLNPLSIDPLLQLAYIEDARGHKAAAESALERAAKRQPANVEPWRRLGRYRLSVLNDPDGALKAFQAAYYLDPAGTRSASDVLEASRAAQAKK